MYSMMKMQWLKKRKEVRWSSFVVTQSGVLWSISFPSTFTPYCAIKVPMLSASILALSDMSSCPIDDQKAYSFSHDYFRFSVLFCFNIFFENHLWAYLKIKDFWYLDLIGSPSNATLTIEMTKKFLCLSVLHSIEERRKRNVQQTWTRIGIKQSLRRHAVW